MAAEAVKREALATFDLMAAQNLALVPMGPEALLDPDDTLDEDMADLGHIAKHQKVEGADLGAAQKIMTN